METTFGFAISGDDEGMKGQENFKFANVVYSKPLLSCFEELGLVCKPGKICSCNLPGFLSVSILFKISKLAIYTVQKVYKLSIGSYSTLNV